MIKAPTATIAIAAAMPSWDRDGPLRRAGMTRDSCGVLIRRGTRAIGRASFGSPVGARAKGPAGTIRTMGTGRAEIRVVRADLDDLDALVPLFDAYRRFYEQPADPEGARTFLADRIKRGESVIFLAVAEGTIVGFTQLYPSFSSVSMQRLWILNDLFVAPDARKSGAGRALLERAERWATETGAKGLTLATHLTNARAQRLYEACGWIKDDAFFHYSRYLSVPTDRLK